MITRYKEYLEFLDKKLSKMFEAQKPFIKCKEGCAYCCKEGEYPLSELEYVYMMLTYNELDDELRDKVTENIITLLKKSREKMYECPFLVDNRCSIYKARGVICRTFGLLTVGSNDKLKVPFCQSLGLNFSKVIDREHKKIDEELVKKYNYKNSPKTYCIDLKTLTDPDIFAGQSFEFGEIKKLIDWF